MSDQQRKLTPAEAAALAAESHRDLGQTLASRLYNSSGMKPNPAVNSRSGGAIASSSGGLGLAPRRPKPSLSDSQFASPGLMSPPHHSSKGNTIRELAPPPLNKTRTAEMSDLVSSISANNEPEYLGSNYVQFRSTSGLATLPKMDLSKSGGVSQNGATARLSPDDKRSPFWFINRIRKAPGSMEFVYLNRIRGDIRSPYNPYALEIVPHADAHPQDYYTMSATGVTHFLNGEADFVPLDKWEREHRIFHRMLEISFFQKYRIWKCFFLWKRGIRRNKSSICEDVLQTNLFILNPHLRQAVVEVRRMCVQIATLKMFRVTKGQTLALEKFVEQQQQAKEAVIKRLTEITSQIHTVVRDACKSAMERVGFGAALGNKGAADASSASTFNKSGSVSLSAAPGAGAGRSSVALSAPKSDEPYKMSYTQLSQMRAECRRLANFIRLADYLVVDALQMLALNTVNEMLQAFTPAPPTPPPAEGEQPPAPSMMPGEDSSAPLFRTEILFKDDSLVFGPTSEAFMSLVDNLLQVYINVVARPTRLQKSPDFKEYLEPVLADLDDDERGDGPDVAEMVADHETYKTTEEKIKKTLSDAFDKVEGFSKSFEPFRAMFLQNRRMDVKRFKEENQSLEFFREAMAKYKSQREEVDAMPTSSDIGIFRLDSSRLKETFLPSPLRCLKDIHDLLPVLAKVKNEELLAELNESVKKLSTAPSSVKKFVDYLAFTAAVAERMEVLESKLEDVTEHYRLLEEEKVRVAPEELGLFNVGTVPTFKTLKASMNIAEESREENTTKFVQNLDKKISSVRTAVDDVAKASTNALISDETAAVDTVLEIVTKLQNEIENLRRKGKNYQQYQDVLKTPVVRIDELDEVGADVNLKFKLWSALKDWASITAKWASDRFDLIDAETINTEVQRYSKLVFQVAKGLPDNPVVNKLRSAVDEFKLTLPVVLDLRNQALKKRHWEQIETVLGQPIVQDDKFTLGLLIELKVMERKDEIANISLTATQEAALEELLKKVANIWNTTDFIVMPHKDSKDIFILGGVEDVITALEDSQVTVATILGSRFVGAIKKSVDQWDRDLGTMSETLDEWLNCQRNWLYLESIFGAPDIQRQLPTEAKMFNAVDKSFKELMKKTNDNPNCYRALTTSGLLERMQNHNAALEKIQKHLEDYLETKRLAFPRFYFLSNDDLLEILSQTKNPQAVQPHMMKCFDSIKSLVFGRNGSDIEAMQSGEGEVVTLGKNLKARGNVESWLLGVEQAMVASLRRLTKEAFKDYEKKPREKWIMDHASQIVLTISQVYWCRDVQTILESPDADRLMKEFKDKSIRDLAKMAALTRTDLTRLQRGNLGALITIDVHARDLVDEMIRDNVTKVTDFGWFKQLKYYWDPNEDDCLIRQTNASFHYSYEYLGCQPRLVITPLTDRVYMTLTGALHLLLGGAPAGPAGTGKTETVKDLAKALARQCVVFNCSDGVTYKMMSKFFAGMIQTGAWLCFDEFNRINIEVLSVIASQLLTIRNALLSNATKLVFEGREVPVKSSVGVFITMNPGYAGRTELPDNLKALFRPVAVMVPDFRLIAEVVLFSEGFENAKNLSQKMVQLYKLSSEQLSSQDHYDFGMRAVKSVLVMAGGLKRANPEINEDLTLIRAMRDSNIPKFVAHDVPLFQGILADLFPGVVLPEQDYGELQRELEAQMEHRKLQNLPPFMTKILQLYETMIVRHGVMLVGPTGGGKSVCRNLLASSLTTMHERGSKNERFQLVHQYELNPKSITYGELYGAYNLVTHEWFDGIVPQITRRAVADVTEDKKWIVFDGPVDTLWIESMNSVLDDSKLLCLDSGERIKLNSTITMLFEVQDLSVASPATVSRCGMVYMDPHDLGWRPVVKTWLVSELPADVSESTRERLWVLFDAHVDNGLKFINKQCKSDVYTVDLNLVQSLCDLFRALLVTNAEKFKVSDESADSRKLLDTIFAFAYIWSIGGNINTESQEKFDGFARDEFDGVAAIPGLGTVYDYFVDFDLKRLRLWSEVVPEFKYNRATPYFQILVPTVDTVRYSYLLKTLVKIDKPVLFNGYTGVGKSVIASNCLKESSEELGIEPVFLQFSAQTSSGRTQEMIEGKLEKKRKNILGPPPGKKIVIFVDDLNMPLLEKFGAQPPIELIRQVLGSGGFYDRKKLFFKEIEGVTYAAACGPPGGGRNPTTPRLLRFFHLLCIPNLADDSMKKIFGSILDGFLEPFAPDVRTLSKPMVASCVEMYNRIINDLRPTPARSHYTFNLRDMSKVFQGVLQIQPRNVGSPMTMTRLFVHECMRCFHDRLINSKDRRYFTELMHELLRRHFSMQASHEELFEQQPIMFGDFLKMGVASEDRMYEEIVDPRRLPKLMDDYLDEYNLNSSKQMNLVFFRDAIEHAARLVRVIRQPRGNSLLVGVGGSGKQSLTRLAAAMADYKCLQIELTRGYGVNEFREDLKKLYNIAGVQNKPVVFLFSDTQIINEGFLEDVNNILNSGEVPNLFAQDEREKIINDVRPAATEAGLSGAKDVVYSYFINRVRDNLHIVLCMSPVGDSFRTRCRMFPSLVNCCTIDWFDEWPADALLSVAKRFFEYVDIESDELKQKIAEMCVTIHSSVATLAEDFYQELRRRFYVTPTSYLEFINLYSGMLAEKRKELAAMRERLQNGLNKLRETNKQVDEMQIELESMQPVLKQKAIDVEQLLIQVAEDTEKANSVRAVVSSEEAIVNEKTREAEEIASDAKRDLDEALPALESAVKALDSLNKNDITEIKSYKQPPKLVQTVMEAVLILRGEKKIDWDAAKAMLGDAQFLPKCVTFDKDNIPESVIRALKKYIENPEFKPDVVGKVSTAAKSLCMWVRAIELYSTVAKTVAPKKAKLKEAESSLQVFKSELKKKQDQLYQVESQLAKLQAKFDQSTQEKKDLEHKSDLCAKRLARATKLTGALGEEAVRWAETVGILDEQLAGLAGNVFLASACIAYYGAFTSTYRQRLIDTWVQGCQEKEIPVSSDFSLINVLSNPVQVRDWVIWGLPTDSLSIENGILVTRSRRWPLMIDPQGQANRWIKNMEAKNGLKVIKLTESSYLRTLENAVRIGTPVLIEDVGEAIDPALEPILLKQTFKQGGRTLIRLGDSDVDYDPNFRFYLTTKLPNPMYLPDVCIKVTLVNCTVTMKGLEDQLLGDVVRKERPDLEEAKDRLVVSVAADKKQLKDIEDKILKLLQQSEGNILDDEVLINTLNDSKVTSGVISARVKEAEVTEAQINSAREGYRPVAIRGSILYFVMADLASMDPMYQYSLEYFKKLFNQCIDSTQKSDILEDRLNMLIAAITESVYINVCRGIFEKDKTIFSFLICVQILRQSNEISEIEWSFLLRGGTLASKDSAASNPDRTWITDLSWGIICAASKAIPGLAGLDKDVAADIESWRAFYDAPEPHKAPLPTGKSTGTEWNTVASLFQRLIILKCLREEKLVFGVQEFVGKRLGKSFVQSPPFDLERALADTTAATPIIFVLSAGADPTNALLRFAREKKNYGDRIHITSLGQGQGPIAKKMIENGKKSGDWVLLQNCHLAASFMNELEKTVQDFSNPTSFLHPDFRLWLTSMPTSIFPIPILQNGVKLTNEPPKGIRANLARSYNDISPDQLAVLDTYPTSFSNCSKGFAFKKLLFGLCFFHSVLQERRKFGPLGWTNAYEFNDSDLEVSKMSLRMFLEEQPEIPWDSLRYVIGEINYGGRVTDAWDRRVLKYILEHFFQDNIINDGHVFSKSGIYRAPGDGPVEDYRAYVQQLPNNDAPEIFGMHENANIVSQMQETIRMMDTVISIQPRAASVAGGLSSEQIVMNLAQDILSHMPDLLTTEEAGPTTFRIMENGLLHSLATVLSHEMERFNKLISVMKSSLVELQKAMNGLVVLSADLDRMLGSLLNNSVPEMWASVAYPSLKPLGSWVKDFHLRVKFMRDWLRTGTPNAFWLSGLFFPQGFMTGVLQTFARRYKIPIDTLSFSFNVLDCDVEQLPGPAEDGVYVYGLYLDGARWDREERTITDSNPGEMLSPLPVIHFLPKVGYTTSPKDYSTPLYKTSIRRGVLSSLGLSTNYILAMDLPTKRPPSQWVITGVAAVSMTDI